LAEAAIVCPCGARWTGRGRAHCGACHRTFTGVTAFDSHRTAAGEGEHGGCREPADVGLLGRQQVYGVLYGAAAADDRWGDAGG
jgi:hypothetical protein